MAGKRQAAKAGKRQSALDALAERVAALEAEVGALVQLQQHREQQVEVEAPPEPEQRAGSLASSKSAGDNP